MTDRFHCAELVKEGRFVVGIASAKEMGVTPGERRNNTTVPQLQVADVAAVLERVKEKGGRVAFGPAFNEDEKYSYGAFADLEANPV